MSREIHAIPNWGASSLAIARLIGAKCAIRRSWRLRNGSKPRAGWGQRFKWRNGVKLDCWVNNYIIFFKSINGTITLLLAWPTAITKFKPLGLRKIRAVGSCSLIKLRTELFLTVDDANWANSFTLGIVLPSKPTKPWLIDVAAWEAEFVCCRLGIRVSVRGINVFGISVKWKGNSGRAVWRRPNGHRRVA